MKQKRNEVANNHIFDNFRNIHLSPNPTIVIHPFNANDFALNYFIIAQYECQQRIFANYCGEAPRSEQNT
jgi:hypothetical protein